MVLMGMGEKDHVQALDVVLAKIVDHRLAPLRGTGIDEQVLVVNLDQNGIPLAHIDEMDLHRIGHALDALGFCGGLHPHDAVFQKEHHGGEACKEQEEEEDGGVASFQSLSHG